MPESHASARESIWRPPLGRLTFGLTLVVAATAFEALAVATVLPDTTRELGGLAWYGWTFSAFMLANLVGITLGGQATDVRGSLPPFLVGTALFSGGLVVSGLASSMPMIVVGRTAQGFGAGLLSAVAYASIATAYSVEAQPRMLATLSSAWVIPGLIGPVIAGVVSARWGWRAVFLGLVPLPLLAAALIGGPLRALPRLTASAPDYRRGAFALELALGAAVALTGLGLTNLYALVALVVVGGVAAAHALSRLMPHGTLRARAGLPAAIATMGLLNFAFFGTEAFLPLTLRALRLAPLSLTGIALTAASLSWTVGAWLPVRFGSRSSRRAMTSAGLVTLGVGLAATLSLVLPQVPVALAVPAWAIAGLGMGLGFTTASAAILGSAAPGHEGETSSALQLAQVLGAAVATGIGGAIVASPIAGHPPSRGIAIVDALMLVAIAIALVSARGIPNQREG